MIDPMGWNAFISNHAAFIAVILAIGFIVLGKLSNMVWKQHRDIENSELGRVADKLEDLVRQIEYLFKKHDKTLEILGEHGDRIGVVEKKISAQYARCTEREKFVNKHFGDFLDGGRRIVCPPSDRIDRES